MMKVIRTLERNFRDAFKSVIRNFSLSIASISCITITLIVVAASMVTSYNVDNFTKLIRDDVTVVVFLDKSVDTDKLAVIETDIKNINNVDSCIFRSKEEVAESMKQSNEIFNNIISEWDNESNPLYDSFLVKVNNIEQIKETADTIKKMTGVTNVKYGEGMIDQLIIVFKVVERVSYGMVIALILVTAFLISNTIKLTIFSRKREIEIMRLVGASNIAIKMPFVIEGLFLGLIGSIIPIIITTYGYVALYNFFGGKMFSPFIRLVTPTPFIYIVSGLLILIGIIVGMFGSWRAVRKHLKI